MNQLIDDIEQLTKVNLDEQTFLLRYLARSNTETSLKAMLGHRKILFLFKDRYEGYKLELLSYAALILAIKTIYDSRKRVENLNFKDMSLDDIREISLQKTRLFLDKEFTRSKPKREKLLRYWSEVKILREEGASFQAITKYLVQKRHVTCAKSTLHKLWHELENENMEK